MPLENLLQLIEKLRDRIQRHSGALRQNEMLTRYVLIDPLLRELGWDTEDPDQVRPEYRSGSGSADYALMSGGKAVVMIEAKKLDSSLQDGLQQAINYCVMEGTPYFAVTDGRRWEIYETHKTVPIADKRVASFDVAGPLPSDVVLSAIALWRPSLEAGTPGLPVTPLLISISPPPPVAPPTPVAPPQVPPSWTPLSGLQTKSHDPPPQSLQFPDGSQKAIGRWTNLLLETVKWLSDKGILTEARCPIRHGNWFLVAMTPIHPNGKPFLHGKSVGSFHFAAPYSAPALCRNTVLILQHLGQDQGQFLIRF